MNCKRLFAGLVVGLSIVGVSCTQQSDFQADAQTTPTVAQEPQTQEAPTQISPERTPDVPYVPTPQAVVDRMLQIANVTDNDMVYDLGSGDGRIPITAVRQYNVQ